MKSWKTTVIGLIGAIATALFPLIKTGSVDPQTLVSAAALAILGFFAKDWNATGTGSTPQSTTTTVTKDDRVEGVQTKTTTTETDNPK